MRPAGFARKGTRQWPVGSLTVCLMLCSSLTARAADETDFKLAESPADDRTFVITSDITVSGKFQTPLGDGKASSWKMESEATYVFRERRLEPGGRDAQAFRSLREYDAASARIRVGEQVTSVRLPEKLSRIVATGQSDGVQLYSPDFLLRREDLDLLNTPGDPLAIVPLLPRTPIRVGEEWNAETFAVQMLTDLDAMVNGSVTCELESVDDRVARVVFEGSAEGAAVGAASDIELKGEYTFDLENQAISELTLTQTEKRSVGAVSPGMEVSATVRLKRRVADSDAQIPQAATDAIPLTAPEPNLMLTFASPWGFQTRHDRSWYVYHQTDKTTILRRLEQGRLVAQCNISKVKPAAPGQHTPEDQFQTDIRSALGEKLGEIENAEVLKPKNAADKRFLYRVTATGAVKERKMRWVYYLIATPSGQQLALVFTMEQQDAETFGERDVDFVLNLEFVANKPTPAAS